MSWMNDHVYGVDLANPNQDQQKILVVDSLGSHWRDLTEQEKLDLSRLQASFSSKKVAEFKCKIIEKMIGHKPKYFIMDDVIPSKSNKDLSYPLVRRAVFIYLYNLELNKLEQK